MRQSSVRPPLPFLESSHELVERPFRPWHHVPVDTAPDRANLLEREDEWWRHSEALWREAHALAAAATGIDAGDVYHALRCLELSPTERLRRGLTRVRHRPHTR